MPSERGKNAEDSTRSKVLGIDGNFRDLCIAGWQLLCDIAQENRPIASYLHRRELVVSLRQERALFDDQLVLRLDLGQKTRLLQRVLLQLLNLLGLVLARFTKVLQSERLGALFFRHLGQPHLQVGDLALQGSTLAGHLSLETLRFRGEGSNEPSLFCSCLHLGLVLDAQIRLLSLIGEIN